MNILAKTMENKNMQRFAEFASFLFILLFVYTALSKLMQASNFESVLAALPLVKDYAGLLSIALPATELAVASLLFFSSTRHVGFIFSLVLMIVFTLYISYMILFSPKLPCSCGGIIQQLSWKQHLLLNIFLTLLAAVAASGNKLIIAINRGNRKPVTE